MQIVFLVTLFLQATCPWLYEVALDQGRTEIYWESNFVLRLRGMIATMSRL